MFPKIMFSMLASAALCIAGCAVNPVTGENELILFGEEQDIEMGRGYAPEVEKQLGGAIENPALQNYVNSVGQKIARLSHNPDFEYSFVAVNDDMVNALALPGGYIFITKGMLQKMQTEAQLAGVLAHEIVHVVARDVANAISKQMGMEVLLAALASQTESQGAIILADLTAQIVSLSFGREDERQADRTGMDYMVRAGYDPQGMVEMMQILEAEEKAAPMEFFSTHPSPENRVAYLQQRARTYPVSQLQGAVVGREDYRKYVLAQLPE
jgi:predicted Zn-dependent protease